MSKFISLPVLHVTLACMILGCNGKKSSTAGSSQLAMRTDQDRIQGNWILTRQALTGFPTEGNGKKRSGYSMTISGNQMTTTYKLPLVTFPGGGPDRELGKTYEYLLKLPYTEAWENKISTFTLHPDTDPKHIDMTSEEGSKTLGIYKLEGDTLTICWMSTTEIRPRRFSLNPLDQLEDPKPLHANFSVNLLTFERSKADDGRPDSALEGSWTVTAVREKGDNYRLLVGTRMNFAGGKATFTYPMIKMTRGPGKAWTRAATGRWKDRQASYSTKATANPKQITMIAPGEVRYDDHILGIYKRDGDDLTICISWPRPVAGPEITEPVDFKPPARFSGANEDELLLSLKLNKAK